MAKSTMTVSVKTGAATAYIRVLQLLSPVLVPIFGPDRVLAWGKRGALWLVLWRIDDGPWRRLR